jgi:hypothetical protein
MFPGSLPNPISVDHYYYCCFLRDGSAGSLNHDLVATPMGEHGMVDSMPDGLGIATPTVKSAPSSLRCSQSRFMVPAFAPVVYVGRLILQGFNLVICNSSKVKS